MSAQNIEKLRQSALEILQKNRREKDGYQYTVPSASSYPFQWFWDSCFHAIILSHFEPEHAMKELRSLCSRQESNGLVPHIIYWEDPKNGTKRRHGEIDFEWGTPGTSSITQPPMLAFAALQVYERTHDKNFLKEIYPKLYHFYTHLLIERDPRRNMLVGILNPDESGEDDSPRFDRPIGLPSHHTPEENFARRRMLVEKNRTCNFDAPFCMKQYFWVKDVPYNAILVRNLSALGKIAQEVGRMDEALHFRKLELEVADSMRDRMVSNGLFWSLFGEEYEKIFVKTWAIFAPLFARILSPEEAEALVKLHLHDEDSFATPFAVPTVARHEPSYNPSGNGNGGFSWRGPVWMATNWFIFKGLMDYGFTEDAARIRNQSAALLEKSGFRENFNPETGEGLGAKDFTWGGLVVDMFAHDLK
jgi:glycogen debranching enzyme